MKSPSRKFSYSKLLPGSFIIACLMFMTLILYFTTLSRNISDIFVLLCLIVLAVIAIVLGVSPLLTPHEIRGNHLVLRQGWYFTMMIPLRYIDHTEIYSGRQFGLSVKYKKSLRKVFILTSDRRMVSIILREDLLVKVIFFKRIIREIIVNVDDTDRFIKILNQASEKTYESLKYRVKVGLSKIVNK